jgi:hypothetical protein
MGSIHPCLMGRWLMTIMARNPAPRTFTTVSATSHYGQWSRASFNNGSKKGRFFFQLTDD